MKMNTMEKLYNAMFYELPEIQVPEEVRVPALKALKAMLEISK
jgi:quinolinate synthase